LIAKIQLFSEKEKDLAQKMFSAARLCRFACKEAL